MNAAYHFLFLKGNRLFIIQHGSANPVGLSRFKYARANIFQNIFEWILKFIYKNADRIIAIDRICYKKAVNSGAKKTTILLRNAINVKQYKPDYTTRQLIRKEHGISNQKCIILFVGRIELPKGVFRILNCINQLKYTGFDFQIFFAGDGSCLTNARKFVERNHLVDCVTFLGHVDHRKLVFFYNMADVLVLPSDTEGIPMVVLESLSCGTPVVASRVGGIPDIIKHGMNGFLIDDLSPENLATMIIKAFKLNQDRKTISDSVQRFSTRNYMIRFDNMVKDLLSSV